MLRSIEEYRQLFINTNLKFAEEDKFCFYTILKDNLMDKNTISKFALGIDNGMEVYYNGKLIQIMKNWDTETMNNFRMFVAIHNREFEKEEFENFLRHMKADKDMCDEFINDLTESPFCNLRDLEFLFGRNNLCILLQNNNLGYTKFHQSELDEYKNYVNWEHLLKNRKDIDGDFLSRYRKEIRSYIRCYHPDSYYQEIKYISYWRCLNKHTSWKTIERYLSFYSYREIFPKSFVDDITREIEFPRDYYFDYFVKGNNPFEKFGSNINLEEFKNNKHMPTFIIQSFIEKVKTGEMIEHKFNKYYYLTIQQFVDLDQFYNFLSNEIKNIEENIGDGKNNMEEIARDLEENKKKLMMKLDKNFRYEKFNFVTFGVYQYNKYRGLVDDNPIIMKKFSNMLQTSSNGIEEFFYDYEIKE